MRSLVHDDVEISMEDDRLRNAVAFTHHDDFWNSHGDSRRPELRKYKTMKTIEHLEDHNKGMENRVPNRPLDSPDAHTRISGDKAALRSASSATPSTSKAFQLLRDYEMAASILESRNRGDFARQKAHILFDHQRIKMDKAFRTAPGGRPQVILESPPQSPDHTVRRALRSASTAYMRRSEVAAMSSSENDSSRDEDSGSSSRKKKKSVSFLDESPSSVAIQSGVSDTVSSSDRYHQHNMDHARCNNDENGNGNGHMSSPIHAACYKGDHVVVAHLLSFYTGSDALKLVNSTCSCGMTPLQVACDQGHTKVVKVLLRRQARVNKRSKHINTGAVGASFGSSPVDNSSGFSAVAVGKKRHRSCIALASACRQPEIIELLLEHGAVVDEDALVTASSVGDVTAVRALMQFHKKANHGTSNGNSSGFAGGLEKLWSSSKSHVDTSSSSGSGTGSGVSVQSSGEIEPTWISNAAAIAVVNEHVAVITALLGDGHTPTSRSHIVSCALDATAVADYKLLRCLTKLYDHALLVSAKDAHQNTLLHLAVKQASAKCVTLLIRVGLDVDARDALGITPLYMACARGQTAIVKLLVNAGAGCKHMGPNDETPLHIAAQENHLSCVLLLLSEGCACVDGTTLDKCTPLHLACQRGNTQVAKCLLDHGADINARTVCDETPLLKASRMSNMETVKLLLARDAEVATSSTSSISSCDSARVRLATRGGTDYSYTASTSSSVFSSNNSTRSLGRGHDEELENGSRSRRRPQTQTQTQPTSSRRHRQQQEGPAASETDAKSNTHTSLRGWLKSVIRHK